MRSDNFRTVIQIEPQQNNIRHSDKIICIGSCFADNIGEKLIFHKFPTLVNPYGVLFNPISISESLIQILRKTTQEAPFFHDGLWQSYQFHGSFSHPNKVICEEKMITAQKEAYEFAKETNWLIISLGSNVVYRLKENGRVVANCHKMPSDTFEKESLSFSEMQLHIEEALNCFKELSPNLRCVLTVSPVRYIKNNFEENSISKAHLRILTQILCDKYDWICYFPAFEIMTDDLRDYRFYSQDRIHPSKEAVDYIWDCFSEAWFNKETQHLNQEIALVQKAVQHRPQFAETESYKLFCRQTLEKIKYLKKSYPFLNLENECKCFEIGLQ